MESARSSAEEIYLETTKPRVLWVRNLDEVRLDGRKAGDFYITLRGNCWGLYYIDAENRLYGSGYDFDAYYDGNMSLIAENVVHVDYCRDGFLYLTDTGELYGMGNAMAPFLRMYGDGETEAPMLLMENVKYACCGERDIVVLKEDNTVWTWGAIYDYDSAAHKPYCEMKEPLMLFEDAVMISGGTDSASHAALLEDGTVWIWGDNYFGQCGIPEKDAREPVCVARDVDGIWMGSLQVNAGYMDFYKSRRYSYSGRGACGLVIRRTDGSLWVCVANAEGEDELEQGGPGGSCAFVPCEIVQEPETVYDGLNTYRPLLEEYERAWEDEFYTSEKWKDVDYELSLYIGSERADLCYSISDLTGDGTEELILGFHWKESEYSSEKYTANIVYAYDVEEKCIQQAWGGVERPITIYEGGIFESCWGAGGVEYRTFFRLQENAAYYRLVSEVSEVWLGEDSDKLGFYIGDEEIKITEEEYWDLVNAYESLPQKELEWHTLDGFCAAQAY